MHIFLVELAQALLLLLLLQATARSCLTSPAKKSTPHTAC
jgi:hypothetical protein